MKSILLENSKDRKINKLISKRFNVSDFNEIRRIRAKLLNKIPNARARNGRWIYQILTYLIDDEIPPTQYKKFNEFLLWLHKNEALDSNIEAPDFNGLPFEYIERYYENYFYNDANNNDGNTQSTAASKVNHINGFTIRRIDDGIEAEKLGSTIYKDEAWCILNGMFEEVLGYETSCYIITNDKTFNTAKIMYMGEIIKLLEKIGYEEMADDYSQEFDDNEICNDIEYQDYFEIASLENGLPPYDEYGLSAIVVITYNDGKIHEIWSRYNLPNCFDGAILTPQQLSSIIGADVNKLCPYVNTIDFFENNRRKNTVTLTEKDLRKIISESIKKVLFLN